ncbi:MAG: ATP-binding protein, partial [Chloroflexota bacterium]
VLELNGILLRRNTPTTLVDLIFILTILVVVSVLIYAAIETISRSNHRLIAALERLSETSVSKAYADNIIDSMEDMLFVVDKQMEIRTVNRTVLKLLKYEAESDLIGVSFKTLFPKGGAPSWVNMVDGKSSMYSFKAAEHKFLTRFEAEIEVSLSSALIEYQQNEFGVVCIGHDISRQKQTEKALREAKESAEEMAVAKSNFLANMSHEIRTPLNGVIGMSTILLDMPLDAESKEYVNIVRSSSESLLGIVNDILDFSKIDADQMMLELAPFNIIATIEKNVDIVSSKVLEKGIDLVTILDPTFPTHIIGDEVRFSQILTNLLSNAVKFTTTGGVSIHGYGFANSENEVDITLKVTDSGVGIPENRLAAIFEPFQQADSSTTRQFGGTGLGLAITKKLVEKMGGKLSVESKIGLGTTFVIKLPLGISFDLEQNELVKQMDAYRSKQVVLCEIGDRLSQSVGRQLKLWGSSIQSVHPNNLAQYRDELASAAAPLYVLVDRGIDLSDIAYNPQMPLRLYKVVNLGQSLSPHDLRLGCQPIIYPLKLSGLLGLVKKSQSDQPLSDLNGSGSKSAGLDLDLKILLVDDNHVNQKVATRILQKLGLKADVASNGVEALVAARRGAYDVILMDLQMPRMDGIEASRRIRNGIPFDMQPHIIALTAEKPTQELLTEILIDMDDFLEKPIKIDILSRALERCYTRVPHR